MEGPSAHEFHHGRRGLFLEKSSAIREFLQAFVCSEAGMEGIPSRGGPDGWLTACRLLVPASLLILGKGTLISLWGCSLSAPSFQPWSGRRGPLQGLPAVFPAACDRSCAWLLYFAQGPCRSPWEDLSLDPCMLHLAPSMRSKGVMHPAKRIFIGELCRIARMKGKAKSENSSPNIKYFLRGEVLWEGWAL